MNEDHTIKYLVDELFKAGIIKYKNYRSARQHVQYWIKTGKLRLRRSRRNNYYLVTVDEVRSIIKAMSNSGEGYWYARID